MPVLTHLMFDLDDTLAPTSHLKAIRENRLISEFEKALRHLKPYEGLLPALRSLQKKVKLSVVTKSPGWYAKGILRQCFPDIHWSAVVVYEDVSRRKPYPDALERAMEIVGDKEPSQVAYIGDSQDDLEAAYHAGVRPVLATWGSTSGVPDRLLPEAILNNPNVLLHFPESYILYMHTLEAYLAAEEFGREWKELDRVQPTEIEIFVPRPFQDKRMRVRVLGRYFAKEGLTLALHERHKLSQQIGRKEIPGAFRIEASWVHAIAAVLEHMRVKYGADLVTVIPAKPGRDPRLELLLDAYDKSSDHSFAKLDSAPDLLAFSDGAQTVKHLSRLERYNEVKKTIRAKNSHRVAGKRVVLLDDVLTTGSTLLAAKETLLEAGADAVYPIALAKDISSYCFEVNPEESEESKESKQCPKCGRPMRIRKNRKSGNKFWGCTGFPNYCTYTESIQDMQGEEPLEDLPF